MTEIFRTGAFSLAGILVLSLGPSSAWALRPAGLESSDQGRDEITAALTASASAYLVSAPVAGGLEMSAAVAETEDFSALPVQRWTALLPDAALYSVVRETAWQHQLSPAGRLAVQDFLFGGLEATARERLGQGGAPVEAVFQTVEGLVHRRLAGLEAVTRRTFLAGMGAATVAPFIVPSPELLAQAPPAPRGWLAPLIAKMGRNRELDLIIWDPSDIVRRFSPAAGRPGFFQKAVEAGVTTVWISGYRFRMLDLEIQRAIVAQANASGLKTLGFIDGDANWAREQDFVARHYDALTAAVSAALRGLPNRDSGNLRIAFATDIEPYTQPQRTGWDGDLAAYSALHRNVIIPKIQAFNQANPSRVFVSWVTLFQPFWWKNGKTTEDGIQIRNLEDLSGTIVAGMTYRDTAPGLLGVSRDIRERLTAADKAYFKIGVETIRGDAVGGDQLTFAGQLEQIPDALSAVVDGIPAEQKRSWAGFFLHFESVSAADGFLDLALGARPAAPPENRPAPPANGGVALRSVRMAGERLDLELSGIPDGYIAAVLTENDLNGEQNVFYVQPLGESRFTVRGGRVALVNDRTDHRRYRPGHVRVVIAKNEAALQNFFRRVGSSDGTYFNRYRLNELLPDRDFLRENGLTFLEITAADAGRLLQARAGLEASEPQTTPLDRLRAFLVNQDVESVFALLVEPGRSVDLTEAFPILEEWLQAAGYQGVAQLVRPVDFPAAPTETRWTVFVQRDMPWTDQVREQLDTLSEQERIRLVQDSAAADLVVGDENAVVSPRQALIQVNDRTARYVTPELLNYLEQKDLLTGGSVVVLGNIYTGDFGEALLLFV